MTGSPPAEIPGPPAGAAKWRALGFIVLAELLAMSLWFSASAETSLGFLLTLVPIQTLPRIVEHSGWPLALTFLAPGPALGALSMLRLRALPEATQLASGNR